MPESSPIDVAINDVLGGVQNAPANAPPPTSKKAKHEAFYAAAQAPDSEKEKIFDSIKEELGKQGYSDYVENLRKSWVQEQETYAKAWTVEKLQDPNVPLIEKKAVADTYRSGEMVDPNLRTQFAERAVEKDMGNSRLDTQAQNNRQTSPLTIDIIQEKIAPGSKYDVERAEQQKTFLQKIQEAGGKFVDATAAWGKFAYNNPVEAAKGLWDVGHTMVSGLTHQTAGGFAGLWMIAAENAEEANGLLEQINQSIYRGDSEGYKAGMDALSALGELIDVPFRTIADETFDATGSPLLGSLVYAVPQAFGYVAGGYVGVKAAMGGAKATVAVKKAVQAANPFSFSQSKNPEYEQFIGPSGEAYYKKKVKQATGIRTEPVIHSLDEIDPDSPASVVGQTNPIAATQLGTSAVLDSSGKLADSMGVTRSELLNTWLLEKIDPELETHYPDIYNALVRKDLEAKQMFMDTEVDNYLFDSSRINNSIDHYVAVLSEQTEAHMNIPNSNIERAGDVIRGKIKFTRNDGYGWTDPHDVFRVANKLNESLKQHGLWSRKKGEGELSSGYQWSQIRVDFDDVTKEYSLYWDFNRKYDAEQDLFFGVDATKAEFGPWDVSGLAATDFGKWLFNPAVRLPKWVTEGFSRADIRASRIEKLFANTLKDNVLRWGATKEIAAAIYEGEQRGKYLSVSEIKDMFPHVAEKKVAKIVEGYTNYRRLSEYMYNISNRSLRSHYIKSGQRGLYNGDEFVGIGRAVTDKDFEDTGIPQHVWDFRSETHVDRNLDFETQKRGTLVKLYRPLHKDGRKYDYAYVDNAEGPIPKRVIPKIDGYFPHINKEPYYISMRPKEVYANGMLVTDPKQIERYIETIGVARTEKEAAEYAKRLQLEHPDAIVWHRAEKYDDVTETLTNMEIAKFNLDVTKSRRTERLRLPDGTLGRIEDPAVAIFKRMQQVVRLDAWKDIDLEFRKRFRDAYEEFLTDGQFPSEDFPLRKPSPERSSPEIIKAYNSAVRLFEHYKNQQHMASYTEKLHKAFVIGLAKKLESVPAIADFVRDRASGTDVFGLATKLTTMKYIHLNPFRQWLLQPAQVTELMPMAIATGNTKFITDASSLAHPMFQAILGEASILNKHVGDFLKEDLWKNTGLTQAEFTEVVEAFKRTGIPTGIDLNSILHGVFREPGRALDETALERLGHAGKQAVMFAPNVSKTVGFSGAELLNNIFLFLYAKSDFETRFPNKKWNDPHNLEMIAAKALSTGNTMMGRGDQLPYQKGTLRAVMQFMSYPHKAILQPFMSKSLTTKEKVAMYTARAFLFGTKRMSAISGLERILNATIPDDAVLPAEMNGGQEGTREQVLQILSNGLINTIANKWSRIFFDQGDTKTDLDIAKSVNPVGDTGIPYGDFVAGMYDFIQGNKDFSRTMPFLSAVSSFTDTYNDLSAILHADEIDKMSTDEAGALLIKAAEWASGYNNFEKASLMKEVADYETRTGQKLGFNLTATEAYAKFFGIQSEKEQILYDVARIEKERKKYIEDTASRIIKDLNVVEDVYGTSQGRSPEEIKKFTDDLYRRVGFLVNLYAKEGLKEELLDEVWKKDAQRVDEGFPSVFHRIMNRKQYELDGFRQREVKIIQKIRESDPTAADLLEWMYKDVENFDKPENKE